MLNLEMKSEEELIDLQKEISSYLPLFDVNILLHFSMVNYRILVESEIESRKFYKQYHRRYGIRRTDTGEIK